MHSLKDRYEFNRADQSAFITDLKADLTNCLQNLKGSEYEMGISYEDAADSKEKIDRAMTTLDSISNLNTKETISPMRISVRVYNVYNSVRNLLGW